MRKIIRRQSKIIRLTKTAEVLRDDVYVQIPLEQSQSWGSHSAFDQVKNCCWWYCLRRWNEHWWINGDWESIPVDKSVGDVVLLGQLSIIVVRSSLELKSWFWWLLYRLRDFVKKAQTSRAPIQDLTDKISGIFVPAVVILGFTFGSGLFYFGDSFCDFTSLRSCCFDNCLSLCTRTRDTDTTHGWTGRSAKMGSFKKWYSFTGNQKVQTLFLIRQEPWPEGKPVVTDVCDEKEVLSLAAHWKM